MNYVLTVRKDVSSNTRQYREIMPDLHLTCLKLVSLKQHHFLFSHERSAEYPGSV
jgi:hypothetical protein